MKRKLGKQRRYVPSTEGGVKHLTIPDVMRIHMRRNNGNGGTVWVNGMNMLLLDQVAADFVEVFIEKAWSNKFNGRAASFEEIKKEVAKEMKKFYPKTSLETLQNDFNTVYETLHGIASGSCPVNDLGLGLKEIDPLTYKAPGRMDLALTYGCNNNCGKCYMGGSTHTNELSTDQWKQAIDSLWVNGVPQLVFTGGEPTLRKDLVELVKYSQEFVTGLITNGRLLASLADELMVASLDYVQVSIESSDEKIHDAMVGADGAWKQTVEGIEAALECGLEVVTNTTLTRENYLGFPDLIRFGAKLGLKTMACNALLCSGRGKAAKDINGLDEDVLIKILMQAQQVAQESDVSLQWYSPTCYNRLNPIKLGLGVKSCSAATHNMTIEPNGRVIPCQSWIHEDVGNILSNPWEKIWNHPICIALRTRADAKGNEECANCEHFAACGGGCPLERILK